MSNWKCFNIGNTNINARSVAEAIKKLGDIVSTTATTISEREKLSNGWKMFDFNSWFKVKARNLNEAHKNAISKLATLTEVDFKVGAGNLDEFASTIAASEEYQSHKPAILTLDQKPHVGQNVYFIGIGDNEGGRFVAVAALTAKEAWNTALEQHKVELNSTTRLGMWQRVIIPVHSSKNWKAIDFTKNIDTPTHIYTDIPIYFGLSDEPFDGDEIIKVDSNGILDGVIKAENLSRITLPGKMIMIGKEDKVETVNDGQTFVRNDFALSE